ncbi:MAG: glutamate--cysteine ligase [Gammaproteobacteria bacterium]
MSKFSNQPNLTHSLNTPLHQLEQRLFDQQVQIECWFRQQWREVPLLFYTSVDLRNAGFKMAPVDTNLFPAGFNNLNPAFMSLYIHAMQALMEKICPASNGGVLIIPENHTSNLFYFENIATLQEIFSKAGYPVRIGSLLENLSQPKQITLPSGRTLTLEPLVRQNNRLLVENFSPCVILLNNDLAGGIPPILMDLEQKVFPSLALGWQNRSKAKHFEQYQAVSEQFAQQFGLDPWVISPLSQECDEVDFMTGEGEDRLVAEAEALFAAITAKYQEYHITYPPFVVVKADAGTYGMAVMMIKDPQEIKQLNRKQRQNMSTTKGGRKVGRVLLQEGVYTFETSGANAEVAEPVVYMLGRTVLGGFYRIHANKGIDENLNAPGMNFEPLAFSDVCNYPCQEPAEVRNLYYSYGVIARLALLAACKELQAVMV